MTVTAVVGGHWGDEGKGKIVDLLATEYNIVARWNGGNNAGHTVIHDNGKSLAFHNVPSGVRHEGVVNVIGNGEVVNLQSLQAEIEDIIEKGVEVTPGNLVLSDGAGLVLPYYFDIEKMKETSRGIGTTGRGIGPAYTFQRDRTGIRVRDLLDSDENFLQNVKIHAEENGLKINPEELLESQRKLLNRLEQYLRVEDTVDFFRRNRGANILLEGAQGVLLDVDAGTTPYVTSSNTVPGGAYTGCLGIPPIDEVIMVMKAGYVTRVGHGPFPTELGTESDLEHVEKGKESLTEEDLKGVKNGDPISLAKYHRVRGGEYGTTTGRPRRIGWQDPIAATYARDVSNTGRGVDSIKLVLTKLDVSDVLPSLKVCTSYKLNGILSERFPRDSQLGEVEPVYEELEGWDENTRGSTSYSQLPSAAQRFVHFLEERLGMSASLISTGPGRKEIIDRR